MERRYYPRVRTALQVDLSHRNRLLGTYTTRDIGMEGLFLKTGPQKLLKNDLVRIHLTQQGKQYQLLGTVVHHSRQGIGLLVGRQNRDLFWATFYNLKESKLPLKCSLVGMDQGVTPERYAAMRRAVGHHLKFGS